MSNSILPAIKSSYPMPPAPAAEPKATAFIKLISKRKKIHEMRLFMQQGKSALKNMCSFEAPHALRLSKMFLSTLLKLMLNA